MINPNNRELLKFKDNEDRLCLVYLDQISGIIIGFKTTLIIEGEKIVVSSEVGEKIEALLNIYSGFVNNLMEH